MTSTRTGPPDRADDHGDEHVELLEPAFVSPADLEQVARIGNYERGIALDGSRTGGSLTVLRSTLRASGGSPVNVHPGEAETLVLLSRAVVVRAGATRREARRRDAVCLPRAVPHTYLVTDDADLVTICAPAGIESFFRTPGQEFRRGPAPRDWPPSPDALVEAAPSGGQVERGPQLALSEPVSDTAVARRPKTVSRTPSRPSTSPPRAARSTGDVQS